MIATPADALVEAEHLGTASRAVPCHGRGIPTNDLWDPPKTRAEHLRQQVVAVVLAFALAALLGQVGL